MSDSARQRVELLRQLAAIQSELDRLDSIEQDHGESDAPHCMADGEGWSDEDSVEFLLREPSGSSEKSGQVLKQHLGSSPLGLIEWGPNFTIRRWSNRAQAIFGWSQNEVHGKTFAEFPFVYEEDIEKVGVAARELIDGSADFNTCFNRNYRKDGKVIYCEWFNSIRRESDSEVASWVSLVHDVSERVESEMQVRQVRNALKTVIEGTSRDTGTNFFKALVRYVNEAFGFRYVMISKREQGEELTARTLAFWADSELAENLSYKIAGTPCENVLGRATCFYPDHIQDEFPDDVGLRRLGAKSYLGTPLVNSAGEIIGALTAIDTKPMDDRPDIREIIKLFADRAALEMEREIAEEARRESETRLRFLTEQTPAVLWAIDTDLHFTQSAGRALRAINVNPGDAVGMSLYEFFRTEDPEFEAIATHLDALQGVSGSFEVEWVGRIFQAYVEPLRDVEGQITGAIGVALDVTELKQTQQSLIESELRFRAIVNHAPEAVVLFDPETRRFVMANPAAERLYQLPVERLCQLGIMDVSPRVQPDGQLSSDLAQQQIAKACAGETPIFEWTHRDSQGRDIPCEVRLLPLEEHGRLVVRGSVTDISEKRRAEESLKKLEADLAHVARVSTMGEMVGGLAHELNQPLFAIQNYAKACGNLVTDGGAFDREMLMKWLDKVGSTAQYAGQVLARLRGFVTQQPVRRVPRDLREIVDTALMLTRYESRRLGIVIEQTIPQSLPPVEVDAVQIQQVLVNLIRNAFDATIQAHVSRPLVQISASLGENGRYVEVEVADNGTGLPKDVAIFDAFKTTKSDGMGLGLAIGTTILEAHEGSLTARNRYPSGAVFKMSLPVATVDQNGPPPRDNRHMPAQDQH